MPTEEGGEFRHAPKRAYLRLLSAEGGEKEADFLVDLFGRLHGFGDLGPKKIAILFPHPHDQHAQGADRPVFAASSSSCSSSDS